MTLIINFGGPRSLEEVPEFLEELLCDQDVIQTPFPAFFHKILFRKIARKRSVNVKEDYAHIGGKSPIFEDTQIFAENLSRLLDKRAYTFHRYLPKTHLPFIRLFRSFPGKEKISVFPLFPQFSYATTGSIARWLFRNLPSKVTGRLQFIKSYPEHPAYIEAFRVQIQDFLNKHHLEEKETILLFSAHGLPQSYVDAGDPYQAECIKTFNALKVAFPNSLNLLSYQSQFGKEEWTRPYTKQMCETIIPGVIQKLEFGKAGAQNLGPTLVDPEGGTVQAQGRCREEQRLGCEPCQNRFSHHERYNMWGKGFQNIVFIPLSFTSDHIETLFEIEQQYMPVCQERGFKAYRCPALGQRKEWIEAASKILQEGDFVPIEELIR